MALLSFFLLSTRTRNTIGSPIARCHTDHRSLVLIRAVCYGVFHSILRGFHVHLFQEPFAFPALCLRHLSRAGCFVCTSQFERRCLRGLRFTSRN